MKVIRIKDKGGLENLILENIDIPKPKAGEVLIKWHATSLNFHDYLVATGAIPVEEGRIPMSDGAGEIIELGENVSEWNVGDKVMPLFFPNWMDGEPSTEKIGAISGESVDGYMCEYSCLQSHQITAIPSGYTYEEASTLPCAGLTAWNGLMHLGHFEKGDSVLIEGTGGMSLLGLQIAIAMGGEVYATTSSEAKEEKLRALGAKEVFNYRKDERWGKSIYKATGGIKHILDVGGGSTMNQSIEATAIGAHITSIGILGNGRKGSITFPKLFFKFINLRGIAVGSKAMQEQMVDDIQAHKIKPIIDSKTFAFDELAEAFRYQESGKQFGKIVIKY